MDFGVWSGLAFPLLTLLVTPSCGTAGANIPGVVFPPPQAHPKGSPCLLCGAARGLTGLSPAQGHPGGVRHCGCKGEVGRKGLWVVAG